MTHYYIQASGAALLNLDEVASIADRNGGALMAIDAFDISDILAGTVHLSSKIVSEKRNYLFFIEAESHTVAVEKANSILSTALTQRNTPVYSDLQLFLRAYSQAPWKDQIQACLLYSDNEEWYEDVYGAEPAIDLVIFAAGSADVPVKEYYRGRASASCLDLLEYFTTIPVQR